MTKAVIFDELGNKVNHTGRMTARAIRAALKKFQGTKAYVAFSSGDIAAYVETTHSGFVPMDVAQAGTETNALWSTYF